MVPKSCTFRHARNAYPLFSNLLQISRNTETCGENNLKRMYTLAFCYWTFNSYILRIIQKVDIIQILQKKLKTPSESAQKQVYLFPPSAKVCYKCLGT